MTSTVESVVANFGSLTTAKFSNRAAGGNPEDQLRAPFERLLADVAALANRPNVTAVGESSLATLRIRPDYAVTVAHALIGFVELKAPRQRCRPTPCSLTPTTRNKAKSSARCQRQL